MDRDIQRNMIHHWLRGDSDAIDLVNIFINISQTWDDLYDGDRCVSQTSVNHMMVSALVHLPRNRFYRRHFPDLQPVIEHCLHNWLDANWLEADGNVRDLQVSYILRSVTTDLIIHVAYLVGGSAWRMQAANDIRTKIYRDNEPFTDYRREIMELRHVQRQ